MVCESDYMLCYVCCCMQPVKTKKSKKKKKIENEAPFTCLHLIFIGPQLVQNVINTLINNDNNNKIHIHTKKQYNEWFHDRSSLSLPSTCTKPSDQCLKHCYFFSKELSAVAHESVTQHISSYSGRWKVNIPPWGDFTIMNTKEVPALIKLKDDAELYMSSFSFKLTQFHVDI